MERLRGEYPSAYLRKVHGSPFQHAGIPDIIGCIEGYFVGLEVKTDSGHVSKIQKLEGEGIVKSQGIYGVVRDAQEASDIVKVSLIRLESKEYPRLT